jgi:hypothetical protein
MHFSITYSVLYSMPQVRYTIEQHVCLMQLYFRYESAIKCRRIFQRKFPEEPVISKQSMHYWSICWKQQDDCQTVSQIGNELYWQKSLDDVGARLETSLRKSLKQLARETGVLRTLAWRATKLLKLWPCKMILHALKEHDLVASINVCTWFLWSIHAGAVDARLVFFFLMRPGFPYVDRWIVRTIGIGVQKIQFLFMNFLFMTKRWVFGVL